ncbi:hypothetical protein C1646_671521 [Rhizophagus diaphanus]|nr:hypothetical protein C1646_671521 [Rhizophagus diaphanus] [Rhizophagus sp. MUCL 43196]
MGWDLGFGIWVGLGFGIGIEMGFWQMGWDIGWDGIGNSPIPFNMAAKLDKKYDANKFTCYLQKFEDEEIQINQLFRLSDAEYNFIGISKIGIRQTLCDKSKKSV